MGDVIGPGDLCSRAATLKGYFYTNLGGTLTTQIEAEAKRDHKKLWASARWLAEKTGMDVADAYALEKAKLGGRTREKKSQAVLTKEGQREDWRQQMGTQRWDSLSPELALGI